MSSKRDYYEVLGVDKNSSPADIKAQYRKLALKFHPDRNKSAEAGEHFKEISEAYAVLSDQQKRQTYDQYGHQGIDGRYSQEDIFQGGNFNFNDLFGGSGGGFDSIFENLFGSRDGYGGSNRGRGADLLYETQITLEDVLHGKKLEIDVKNNIKCEICGGDGCRPGTSKTRCSSCNGQGQVRQQRKMGFASFVTVVPCNSCRGQGMMNTDPCPSCKGEGKTRGSKHLSFEIPAGTQTGDYTIPNEGEYVPDGTSGDLIVRVHVLPHSTFKHDGVDIFYDQDITIVDAALGIETMIPTLDGNEKIRIDEGTQPNDIKKLRGKGLPYPNSNKRGDLFVRMVVHVPKKLSREQKAKLQEFEKTFD